ncbi:hypothetical protein EVAR_40013_1 [Eumeta japonica]|uniref:Uncharacterized protein n=1 Tax=Eumeta variegata TaxID=151549 RepID=A0A4C1YQD4_EUMVA|nr:hypothetical protein EVAR_40013_1 [Eumeta japonica]
MKGFILFPRGSNRGRKLLFYVQGIGHDRFSTATRRPSSIIVYADWISKTRNAKEGSTTKFDDFKSAALYAAQTLSSDSNVVPNVHVEYPVKTEGTCLISATIYRGQYWLLHFDQLAVHRLGGNLRRSP